VDFLGLYLGIGLVVACIIFIAFRDRSHEEGILFGVVVWAVLWPLLLGLALIEYLDLRDQFRGR
jgi:hypothetical protein